MKLNELKEWINKLPVKFLDYTVVNGEYGNVDGEIFFRVDKPVTCLTIDESTQEIVILNDKEDELTKDEIE